MTGLIVLFALWIVVVIGVWLSGQLNKKAKTIILVPLLMYGIVSAVSIGQSYRAGRPAFAGITDRMKAAEAHLAAAKDGAPDSVFTRPLVQSAKKVHAELQRTVRFGLLSWGVSYRYGIFPRLNGDAAAASLVKLVDVPAQLVYAEVANARNARDYAECYDYRMFVTRDFPMNYSRTAGVISMILDAYKGGAMIATGLCDSVKVGRDDARDPRSQSYRLAALATKLVGMQNKLDQLLNVGCGAFDEEISLNVRDVQPMALDSGPQWTPLSPLFMDFTPLVPNLAGITMLEIRWEGDPPRPILGTTEPLYRIDCETSGTWPAGQDSWTDSTGHSGPTYFADASAGRVFARGVRLLKWSRQPDVRALNIRANAEDLRYAGIPTVDVPEELFLPRADRSKQR